MCLTVCEGPVTHANQVSLWLLTSRLGTLGLISAPLWLHTVVQTSALVFIYVNITEDVNFNMTFKIRMRRPAEGAIVRFLCNACVSNERTTRGSSSKQIAARRCRHGRTKRNKVSQNILLWVGPNSVVRWGSYCSALCPSLAFPLLMSLAHQTFQDRRGE